MKAVLVIDTPKDCYECPCYSLNAQAKRFECDANLTIKGKIGVVELDKKPRWCPLRPLPHKLQADWYADGYKEGFNACLEEITGETE